jgi:hypothetical protein
MKITYQVTEDAEIIVLSNDKEIGCFEKVKSYWRFEPYDFSTPLSFILEETVSESKKTFENKISEIIRFSKLL